MIKIKFKFEITINPRIHCFYKELKQSLKIKIHYLKNKAQNVKISKDDVTMYCAIAMVILMIIQILLQKGFFIDSLQQPFLLN